MAHETWAAHLDYFIVLLGYNLGLGALWKFPYLCMRNGGGAFLVPFLIFTLIGVIPCVFLETTIGQFSQSGPVKVWNLCPPFKGIGVGMVTMSMIIATYHPSLFAWFLYYLYHIIAPKIPWVHCDNPWNTPSCISQYHVTNETSGYLSATANETVSSEMTSSADLNISYSNETSTAESGLTAAEEFWRYRVLEISDGLEDIGGIRWPLVLCLVIVYCGVFLIMFKGVKVSGKVVYVTVCTPYVLLIIFLVRGCLLPGASSGIYYYIYPNFEKLKDPEIWIEGCNYALYSMSVAWGGLITLAGHNKFSNNCFRDALLIVLMDTGTAVFVGFPFFAIMGHVAYIRGVSVDTFASSGYNLGFIVYPEAVATLPIPHLWSVLAFITFLTLGIDTLLPSFEVCQAALVDKFPRLGTRTWVPYLVAVVPCFFINLIFMTQGGMYIMTLVDWYAVFPGMALYGLLECFVVGWIYGIDRLDNDARVMWKTKVPRLMFIAVKYICPFILLAVFGYSLYSYRPPMYEGYVYPGWATAIGWLIVFASVFPLPVIFVWTVYKSEGRSLREKLRNALKPSLKWDSAEKVTDEKEPRVADSLL